MEKYKQLLAGQIESILSAYNPYLDKLNEGEKKDLEDITKCLQILKSDSDYTAS